MRCYLFASERTVALTQRLTLGRAVENAGHTWRSHVVECLADTVRHTQLPDPVPDFADQPFVHWSSTQVYVAHLLKRSFAFRLGAPTFTPVDFIEHLRKQGDWCSRAVFASCHAHGDVWPVLSDRASDSGTDPVMPVLLCCKHDVGLPLTDRDVLTWLAALDWASHLLGLPINEQEVVVPRINMSWRWVMI